MSVLLASVGDRTPPLDLVAEVEVPFTRESLHDPMGVPEQERPALARLAKELLATRFGPQRRDIGTAIAGNFARMLRQCAIDPQDGLLDSLAAAVAEGKLDSGAATTLAKSLYATASIAAHADKRVCDAAIIDDPLTGEEESIA
jgi:hypothetical protein